MAVEPGGQGRISIVTIALNAASALPLTLESVVAQTYPHTETVVLDGGSWDRTGDVLRRYAPAVDRIVVAEDAGIYHAMNDALEHVTGEHVLFMNAGDQFYDADAIARTMRALEDDPDVFYGNHVYVDRGLEQFRRAAPFDHLAQRLAQGLIDGTWVSRIPCHQATFARADLLRRLRYDTRLRVGADHDLLFRAHAAGARMQYVDEIVCHYFGGGFSVRVGDRSGQESASTYRRHSDRPDLVDRFFFPGSSLFPPLTRRTGLKLGGFLPVKGSGGSDWVAARGADMLAPERPSGGLELAGYNEQDEQAVTAVLDGVPIGEAAIERGSFRLELGFDRVVPPGAVLTLVPARTQPLADRQEGSVGFAVRTFRFAVAADGFEPGIAPGERIAFASGARETILPLLGHGWSEPEVTHTWSVGDRSELWLKLAPEASHLLIEVSSNPHTGGNGQQLRVEVNGQPAGECDIAHGVHVAVRIDCERDGWRPGAINRVVLAPSAFAAPPPGSGDDRPLGFCLWALEAA